MKISSQRKKKTYDFLVSRGHWHEAQSWKEALRKGPPKISGDEAWTAMERKFLPTEFLAELDLIDEGVEPHEPPEPDLPPATSDLTEEEVEHLAAVSGGEVNLRDDLEWAYSNHLNSNLSATDAPTPGAWGLLKFAGANPTKFMELAIKLLSTKKSSESEDRWGDNCPETLDLIDKLLAKEGYGRHDPLPPPD